jgi:hypothetical protein
MVAVQTHGGFYINHSLFVLITKGKGEPSQEENEIEEKASHY